MGKIFNEKLDQVKVLVTNECNLHCTHCFRSEKEKEMRISYEKLVEIVDYAVKRKAGKLSFSGGEFFTHPDAYKILSYCEEKEIPVSILTNGTSLDLDYLKEKKKKDKLSFQVSVDGKRETHDLRRGAGNFDRTMKNVKALAELGYAVTASMVLDFHNYKDIIDVMKLPYFTGFNCLPLAYTNEANRKLNDENPETRKEYDAVVAMMYQHQKKEGASKKRCHMFPAGLGIRYDGNVYPCAVARDYDLLCMGNLTEQSLENLIKNFFSTDEGKIVTEYVDNDIEECRQCASNEKCNRGCRIRAYKLFGKMDAPDLFCCRIFGEENSDSCLNDLFWGNR